MRTLPLRLSPVDGESLPGYVLRYSHTFQLQPGDLIRAVGLDGGTGSVATAGRYGVRLSTDQLQRIAFTTGIATERLEEMLLARYAGRAFDRSGLAATIALAGAPQGHEVLVWSSRFCPQCLRDDGAWLLRWQLSWSVVCLRHRLLLERFCPECGAVPEIGPRARWAHGPQGALTDPTMCWRRRERDLCRADLASVPAVSVASDPNLLAAQRRINEVLDTDMRPTLAGAEFDPLTYLRDVRALCTLLHRHLRPTPGLPSPGPKLLDHPAAAATVLTEALGLAALPDQATLTAALRDLANRRYRADGHTLVVGKLTGISPTLREALRHAVSGAAWAPACSRMGLHPRAHRRPEDLDQRLEARHVPQLFWADDYQHQISELFDFDDFTHWLGRRFCSVLLARMLIPLDWLGAVRYLDFPETQRFINDGYNTTFVKLRSNSRFEELVHRVKRIANQHAQQELIDHKQRRAQLAEWDGIDIDCWHLLPPRPRPLSPFFRRDNPVRRRRASLWLWSQLASGDERAGPIVLRSHKLHEQTHFANSTLAPLRDRLLILGELLLTTPTDGHSTLHNRLAATLHHRGHLAENFYLNTIDPQITSRVLAHVSAHTGVDIPSLTTPPVGSRAAPAVTHARLLSARLLRRISIGSFTAIAAAVGGDGNHLADNDRFYREALERDPRLSLEVDQLVRAIDDWQTPAPNHPTSPHHQRMRDIALEIKTRSAELLAPGHGSDAARRTSIALCRQHSDLSCPDIANIHRVKDAQPTYSQTVVDRHRRENPDFDRRYQQLLSRAQALQRRAGYTNANLKRGLISTGRTPQGSKYVSHGQLR